VQAGDERGPLVHHGSEQRDAEHRALATFLLKILMPGFFVRDRPDRASSRKTQKAGDFPARQPGEPSVTTVTRRIEFHLLYPWQVTGKQVDQRTGRQLGSAGNEPPAPAFSGDVSLSARPRTRGARDATHAIPL
jgi:hypothetical protein